MSQIYIKGNGVKKDVKEAVRLLRIAAENGSADAQLVLGSMYVLGEVVEKDYSLAREYFGKACDNKKQKGCEMYKEMSK